MVAEVSAETLFGKFREIAVENAFDAIVVTDCELDEPGPRILYVNPAFTRITGYSAEEVVGRSPRFLQGPETEREVLDKLRHDLEAGRATSGEIINYRKDGEPFWTQWRILPVPDAEGRAKYFVSTQRDITERKNIERVKSEVIGSVSHEMRSPLTAIYGALDLLRQRSLSVPMAERGQLVANALIACERLKRLVDSMLDIEQLAAGSLDFHLEPIELAPLIRQTITFLHLYSEEMGVRVEFESHADGAQVLADRDRLIQVVTNLVTNAVKFSPNGAEVRVALERCDGMLRLVVEDHGPGIPEEFQPRLFERYARAGDSSSPRHRGVGLGLAISKDIVDQLGGQISYETAVGRGTTFYVALAENRQAAVAT